ncbi:MAG: hypothetical protein ACLFUJ_14405 [Phycisphaerae bacterium]
MSRNRAAKDKAKDKKDRPIPQPVDRHDGIPDASASPHVAWLIVLGAVFVAWAGFLVWVKAAS